MQRQSEHAARSLLTLGRRVSPDTWALLTIAGAVLLANLVYVAGLFDPNPLSAQSGLATGGAGSVFAGNPTLDPSNGWIAQGVGHRAAVDLLHLRMPWWNPYE